MKERYDVVVIGAGPAGGAFAAVVAQSGRSVLLVERSAWLREKVCGGCLNAGAVCTLERLELAAGLQMLPLSQLELVSGSRRAVVETTGGAAVLRSEMDAGLVSIAQARKAEFLPGTSAVVGPRVGNDWCVRLTGAGTQR
ncbi:MAG: FAD-dependent oxidoreductase [Phycisphaerales bacterium]